MRRVHLIEFEDKPWWPAPVRDGATAFLAYGAARSELPYREFVPRLAAALRRTGDRRLVDLCSGGGGPMPTTLRLLREREGLALSATLTDLYPNLERFREIAAASGGTIEFLGESIDASNVPASLEGFRILSNSFHHFRSADARRILADAVRARRGIAVVEWVERRPASILFTVIASIFGLFLTPFIRPFRLSRLVFCWLVPLIPLTLLVDGIVSCLRAYSVPELEELVSQLPDSASYEWRAERLPYGALATTLLVGVPR